MEEKLEEHQIVHTGEKPLLGNLCDKIFFLRSVLIKHQSTHWNKAISCDNCDNNFYQQCFLKKHQRVHFGEKPIHFDNWDEIYSQRTNLKILK